MDLNVTLNQSTIFATSNSTTPSSTTIPLITYLNYIIYLVQGSFMVPVNLVLFLTIVLRKEFRQRRELILIAAYALVNEMFGISTFWIGLARLLVTMGKGAPLYISSVPCYLISGAEFNYIPNQASCILMIAMGLDRLYAVLYFQKYNALSLRSVYVVFAVCILHSIISLIMSLPGILAPTYQGNAYCQAPGGNAVYNKYQYVFIAGSGYVSIVIHILVIHFHRVKFLTSTFPGIHAIQLKRQRKLTITLCIVSVHTFLFQSVPYTFNTIIYIFNVTSSVAFTTASTYGIVLVRFNSFLYVIVLLYRMKDLRQASLQLLRLKRRTQVADSINGGTK